MLIFLYNIIYYKSIIKRKLKNIKIFYFRVNNSKSDNSDDS